MKRDAAAAGARFTRIVAGVAGALLLMAAYVYGTAWVGPLGLRLDHLGIAAILGAAGVLVLDAGR